MPKLKSGTIVPTLAEDKQIAAGIKKDQNNPQWTSSDFAQAKPAAEFFEPKTYTGLVELTKRGRGKRGPQKAPTKIAASVRFDPDVLERLRASGRGWATLVNDTMRALLFSADAESLLATKHNRAKAKKTASSITRR